VPLVFECSVSITPPLVPAATPTFLPAAGSYGSAQSVTISCSTPASSIYYTTDGSTPTFPITGTTQLYTVPVSVTVSETLKAIGTAAGFLNSVVGSAPYTIGAGNGPAIFAVGGVSALANSVSGTAYSQQLIPSFGVGPYSTFTLVNTGCDLTTATAGVPPTPNNTFAVSPSGLLTCGSISATAENNFFLIAYKDSTNATFKQNFACYNAANPLKIVTPSNLGFITQGNVYTNVAPLATIKAAGNLASLTWSLASSFGGLSFPFTTNAGHGNSWTIDAVTGNISGTATNIGVNTIVVQCTDGTNTTTELFNIGVYQYVTGAPRPSYNPSSGTNSQGIPCGAGLYVLNGEVYEPNGRLFRANHGWNATYPNDQFYISTPRYNALGMNLLRVSPDTNGTSLATETTEVNAAIAQHTNNHRVVKHMRYNNYAGTIFSGSSTVSLLGNSVSEWIGAYASLYSAQMNNMWVNIANEWGSFGGTTTGFAAAYSAASAPITGLTATTLTFSGASPFNSTNIDGLLFVYIKGATWSGANNDGLYAVTTQGASTITGTFPSGYVSGGTAWAGVLGMMRAGGFYGPIVIDCGGGSSYLDIVNNGVAIFQSDPLQSVIMSYHAYYNGNAASTSQSGFESNICAPLNTNKLNSGVPWMVGELGIYYPDGRAGSPTGGVTTDFPTPQYLQSTNKFGVPCLAWVSYMGGSVRADTTQGFNWYTLSSSNSDASDAGYPSVMSVFGKRINLDPIYGTIVNSTGPATSF
jgi:Chitobiase/beta-hexosaminidase C-terminal domain